MIIFQIGLDGIRMLDPASGRTLRIYPLDMLTKWEVSWFLLLSLLLLLNE